MLPLRQSPRHHQRAVPFHQHYQDLQQIPEALPYEVALRFPLVQHPPVPAPPHSNSILLFASIFQNDDESTSHHAFPPCKIRVVETPEDRPRVEDRSFLLAHAASDQTTTANFSFRCACTRNSTRSDFISLSIRLDFMNVPTVATGSDDCNIDTAHALLASVCVHGHCIAHQ